MRGFKGASKKLSLRVALAVASFFLLGLALISKDGQSWEGQAWDSLASREGFIRPIYSPEMMPHEDLQQDVYIYQNQSMREVSWLYVGMAPRMEDPSRVEVVFSKQGYTMRVTMELTRREIAAYPRYLVSRAEEVMDILADPEIQVHPDARNHQAFLTYLDRIEDIQNNFDLRLNYSGQRYQQGLTLLREYFPENVFELPTARRGRWWSGDADGAPDEVAVIAHFVYPITIHRRGSGWPHDGVYIQAEHYSSRSAAINERRTDYGERVWVDSNGDGQPDRQVRRIKNHIFSGFPAFWLDSKGAGTGVHGPIRYSERDQRGLNQSGPYGRTPEAMTRFWTENEFIKDPILAPSLGGTGVDITAPMRWDVVRTNDSNGCFRAETMELRHLLPSDSERIYREVRWRVITEVDEIVIPSTGEVRLVDIDYYLVNPYQFPQSRRQWVGERILTPAQRNSAFREDYVDEFLRNSHQFPYLDPSTVELQIPLTRAYRSMQRLNQSGRFF